MKNLNVRKLGALLLFFFLHRFLSAFGAAVLNAAIAL
jgi:hypothetical protein